MPCIIHTDIINIIRLQSLYDQNVRGTVEIEGTAQDKMVLGPTLHIGRLLIASAHLH